MTMQLSTTGRNAMLDAFEAHVGTAPTARLRTGAHEVSFRLR